MMLKDVLPEGAFVNLAQQRMMQDVFRINAWTYVHENPIDLRNRLDEQEKALKQSREIRT